MSFINWMGLYKDSKIARQQDSYVYEGNYPPIRVFTMNSDQQAAYEAVLRGENILLTGPGGTGKSFVIKKIIKGLQRIGRSYTVTATTGAAAVNLGIPEARTIDSFLKLQPSFNDILPDYISFCLYKGRSMCIHEGIEVIIIDEVSMLTPRAFEAMDEILSLHLYPDIVRKFENIPTADNGVKETLITEICRQYRSTLAKSKSQKQFVLSGDFFQLPYVQSVAERKMRQPIVQIFDLPLWRKLGLHTYQLTKVERQACPQMRRVLNQIREGRYTSEGKAFLEERSRGEMDASESYVHLFIRNDKREAFNTMELRSCTGQVCRLIATDQCEATKYHRDMFQRDIKLPATVSIKKGCQVILLRNLSATLINGSIGKVIATAPVTVRFTNGEEACIPIVKEDVYDAVFCENQGRTKNISYGFRKQYPLDLAYGLTFNKAQGMSLERVVVHLDDAFSAGHVYTGLSRATTPAGLIIRGLDLPQLRMKRVPRNVGEFYARTAVAKIFFEDEWLKMKGLIEGGCSLPELHSKFPSLNTPLRLSLVRKRTELQRLSDRSPEEAILLRKIQELFGLQQNEKDTTIGRLFIKCPLCDRTIDECELMTIGLLCVCGCGAKELLDVATNKFGWACYLIQRNCSETHDMEYIGITERGGVRLSEHARVWFKTPDVYTFKCSLRLGETTLLRLYKPRRNVHLRGNAKGSWQDRIGNENQLCVESGLVLPLSISFRQSYERGSLHSESSGTLFLPGKRAHSDISAELCMLEGTDTCVHVPPCFLQKESNKRLGRPEHYPHNEERVRKKRHHQVEAYDKSRCAEQWTLEEVIRIRNRGLVNEETKKRNASPMTTLWRMGLLRRDSGIHTVKELLRQMLLHGQLESRLPMEIKALVKRMHAKERDLFLNPELRRWLEDDIFNFFANGKGICGKQQVHEV